MGVLVDTGGHREVGWLLVRCGNPFTRLGCKLFITDHGDHFHPGGAHRDHDDTARLVGEQVSDRVMDDVTTWFPEGLSGLDRIWCLTLELEQHLSFEHVAENGAGVTVGSETWVSRRQLEEPDHRGGTRRDGRWHNFQQILLDDV